MSRHREIYLVEVMALPKGRMAKLDPTGIYTRKEDPDHPFQHIAIFRRRVGEQCPPRIYQPYKYRPGLRYQRLLKILGRHR